MKGVTRQTGKGSGMRLYNKGIGRGREGEGYE